jgi:hypothetical protein
VARLAWISRQRHPFRFLVTSVRQARSVHDVVVVAISFVVRDCARQELESHRDRG